MDDFNYIDFILKMKFKECYQLANADIFELQLALMSELNVDVIISGLLSHISELDEVQYCTLELDYRNLSNNQLDNAM